MAFSFHLNFYYVFFKKGGNPNKSVTFSFDRCYNNKSTTAHIYDEIPYSLVQVILINFKFIFFVFMNEPNDKT